MNFVLGLENVVACSQRQERKPLVVACSRDGRVVFLVSRTHADSQPAQDSVVCRGIPSVYPILTGVLRIVSSFDNTCQSHGESLRQSVHSRE